MIATVRRYNPKSDEAFIYASWTRNQYYSAKEPIKTPKRDWFTEKCIEIKRHLDHDRVIMAVLQDDPDFIIGYVVFRKNECQWLYIKKNYRNAGIEALLLSQGDPNGKRTDEREESAQEPEQSH